jgi:hypothetical protein
MITIQRQFPASARHLALVLLILGFVPLGCSRDKPGMNTLTGASTEDGIELNAPTILDQDGSVPPTGLVPIDIGGGRTATIWPYTGESFNGVPSDPINLVFLGKADPVRIRAALLALDGDRTAFGLPDAPPFNSRWSDCQGDVQTTYTDGPGWSGSVIQLQLGTYQPVRAHLRLFRTGIPDGSGGTVTLGAAHFEVLIPGTTSHQVLSWEVAQQLVTLDLARTGLLGAAPSMSGPINAAPSFREIPDFIYNQLPPELIGLIQGPPPPIQGSVPLASDGRATVFQLAGEAPIQAGTATDAFTLQFQQAIPKPLCSDGPYDWVYVTGPVEFVRTSTVDATGRYEFQAHVSGKLTVTPVDITTNPPTPVGQPFNANISDVQQGYLDPTGGQLVSARVKRIGPQSGGAEILTSSLKVSSPGPESYRLMEQCLQPLP